jgi:hypothetical protein
MAVSPSLAGASVIASNAPLDRPMARSALCAKCVRPFFIFVILESGSRGFSIPRWSSSLSLTGQSGPRCSRKEFLSLSPLPLVPRSHRHTTSALTKTGIFRVLVQIHGAWLLAMPSCRRGSTRARSRSKPARPYICRFMIFSRLTCPST